MRLRSVAVCWTTAVVVLVSVVCARASYAQATEGADRLPPHAVTESLAVLHSLDVAASHNSKEAALWYHRGMLAWSLWERSRHLPPISGLDWTTLAPIADMSLRKAAELEPDNDEYFLAVGRYLTSAGVTFRAYGPYGVINEGLERARRSGDPAVIAEAALQVGRADWLRYDRIACKALSEWIAMAGWEPGKGTLFPVVEGGPARRPLPPAVGPFAFLTPQDNSYVGETDYLKAELLFREAYDAAPDQEPTFRRYATLLADQKRWTLLASLAHNQTVHTPSDPWAWMTLGLASHKLRNNKVAIAAFDTALHRFPADERRRLDRVERVLGPVDAANFARMTDSSRAITEAFYWRNQSPLWSVEDADARAEFLSRITFAELRWTQEEINLNGVNSDFGNLYIRTGIRPTNIGCVPMREAWYVANDTTVLRGKAAVWPRLAGVRIDTIPAQVARFRAVGDSTDVFIATLPPVAGITKAGQVVAPVRTDFWLLAGGVTDVARDSVPRTDSLAQVFRHRLPPGGYVYRTEASADGALLAARGTGGFVTGADKRTGFTLTGFGMSDVLVALHAEARGKVAQRWTDFNVTPLVGPVSQNTQISLIWENYEFGQDGGSARYGLSITIQHEPPPTAPERSADGRVIIPPPVITSGKIAAAITNRDVGKVGVTRTDDKVEFTFERTMPYAAIFADDIEISVGKTPPGNYLLTLRVTDRVTGTTTGRSQRLTIPAPPPPKACMYFTCR